jgi:LysM repeat protein
MSDYAIFFDYDNKTYRLPVNPEQLEKESVQAISKYEILKLGQIAIPTHMELTEYTFEAEFPHEAQHYIETSGEFKDADFYLNLFAGWRNKLVSPRFIASNGIGDDTNTLVLIESVKEIEKAGEEGDKYVSFKLLEYRDFSKKPATIVEITSFSAKATKAKKKKAATTKAVNPKSNGYHIVKSGDSLWSIAKKYYGDGAKYNKIYNANKDKIKNPALIMSGQKLVIPV